MGRKVIYIACIINICFCLCTMTTFASDVYISKYFRYTVEEQSVTILGYNGSESEVAIPAQIARNPVNVIAKGAFVDCDTVLKITLPDTIMIIEEGAFAPGQIIVHDRLTESEEIIGADDGLKNRYEQGNYISGSDTKNKEETTGFDMGDIDEGNINFQKGTTHEILSKKDKSKKNTVFYFALFAVVSILSLSVFLITKRRGRKRKKT